MFGEHPSKTLVICIDKQEVAFSVQREGFAILHIRYGHDPFDLYTRPRNEKEFLLQQNL